MHPNLGVKIASQVLLEQLVRGARGELAKHYFLH